MYVKVRSLTKGKWYFVFNVTELSFHTYTNTSQLREHIASSSQAIIYGPHRWEKTKQDYKYVVLDARTNTSSVRIVFDTLAYVCTDEGTTAEKIPALLQYPDVELLIEEGEGAPESGSSPSLPPSP